MPDERNMPDDTKHQERLRKSQPAGHASASPTKEAEAEAAEASCGAFGYLRGLRDQSAAIELRFRNGNSIVVSVFVAGNWQYNPSDGLLLKFSGDLVYLVLIRGSNIDRPLTRAHQPDACRPATASRAVDSRNERYEVRASGRRQAPTIDSIEVAEFESNADLENGWPTHAPEFANEWTTTASCNDDEKDSGLETEKSYIHDTDASRRRGSYASTSADRHSGLQIVLVGRREVGAIPEADQAVGALHRLAGGRHPRAHRDAVGTMPRIQ